MLYKVYVIYAPAHGKLHVGITTRLGDSMLLHNGDEEDDQTNQYKPWTLIHMEIFNDESEAHFRKTYLESPAGQAYITSDILSLFEF